MRNYIYIYYKQKKKINYKFLRFIQRVGNEYHGNR